MICPLDWNWFTLVSVLLLLNRLYNVIFSGVWRQRRSFYSASLKQKLHDFLAFCLSQTKHVEVWCPIRSIRWNFGNDIWNLGKYSCHFCFSFSQKVEDFVLNVGLVIFILNQFLRCRMLVIFDFTTSPLNS